MVMGPEQSCWPGTLVIRIVGMTRELKWLLIGECNFLARFKMGARVV